MPLLSDARFDHCSYVVPDLEAVIQFFTNYFGFELLDRQGPFQSPPDDYDFTTRVYAVPERAIGHSAMMQFGQSRLEFVQWTVYDQPINPLRESTISGCQIVLRVADLEQTIETLKSIARMRFMETGAEGFVYCFTPFGFQIKLVREEMVM